MPARHRWIAHFTNRSLARVLATLLLVQGQAPAFEAFTHWDITEQILVELRFREFARVEIKRANECIDVGPAMSDDDQYCHPKNPVAHWYNFYQSQSRAEYHFDDESIPAALDQLGFLRKEILRLALAGEYVKARKKLGAALHAIQDFYAHTNWVELGQRVPFEDAAGTLRFAVDPNAAIGPMIRFAADQAVCGIPGVPLSAGQDTSTLLPVASAGGGVLLTSGYFFSAFRGPGKCTHGWQGAGINKDEPDRDHGPMIRPGESKTYHQIALDLAIQHSKQFVNDIVTQLDQEQSLRFRTASMVVYADRPNIIPTIAAVGETWVFRAPVTNPPQLYVWGYRGVDLTGQRLYTGPDGFDPGGPAATAPMPNQRFGALIGKLEPCAVFTGAVQLDCSPRYFYIDSARMVTIPGSGRLSLLVNDGNLSNNRGSLQVEFTRCAEYVITDERKCLADGFRQ